ncbi:MAG TPA: sigma-70 family RNA polymerase sigma factor [Sphingomonas bacterium]|jgi:RNA polymerase sigma-70 factor (ECF subfamily)|uniref:Sigma-70 family RNA polymerase sigma factor n=1 Tax=Sphingomonas bacterium TaxID=1895847 RepID=A0A3D0WGE3_9SPHN|nr:sigma-70 family RNA polymerase sigma factor [Sphingomonas bacterium]
MSRSVADHERPAWVARHILPHEAALRAWLRGAFPGCDTDDLVQESYCRIASVTDLAAIDDPRRYLFQTARNLALSDVRRAKIVRIEAVGSTADLEDALADDRSPERITAGRALLARVEALMDRLPERARRIVWLRRIEGLSQREIAAKLGVTETVVENDVARSLRIVMAGLSEDDRAALRPNGGRRGRA